MSAKTPADIPIIFCKTCNKAPMIVKTINQRLLEKKDGLEIEFECPTCGAMVTERLCAAPVQP